MQLPIEHKIYFSSYKISLHKTCPTLLDKNVVK